MGVRESKNKSQHKNKSASKRTKKITTDNENRSKAQVEFVDIDAEHAGQRIDNFLFKRLKGVPKSRLYRALRSGEVRVNGARIRAPYKLSAGDRLRIPPIRTAAPNVAAPSALSADIEVLHEDAQLLIIDKPAGLAVHGGSFAPSGVIESLRQLRDAPHLQLAHRLDRDTSGCLVLTKSRDALRGVQTQLQQRSMHKHYLALLAGAWQGGERRIDESLARDASSTAREAVSVFAPREVFGDSPSTDAPPCTLTSIRLLTGRMHQARAHAATIKHPIAGDKRHGDFAFNRAIKKFGLTRLFLHAETLRLHHPHSGKVLQVHAPLPEALVDVLTALRK